MFDTSCTQPDNVACGLLGPQKTAPTEVINLSLEEFLSKLDLYEYKSAIEAAGIYDVEALSRLTESDLDQFHLRKLEKRKLVHHLMKARGGDVPTSTTKPTSNDPNLCGAAA